jgi:hypothetical protein
MTGKKKTVITFLILLIAVSMLSGQEIPQYRFWNQGPLGGEITLSSFYRNQTTQLGDLREEQNSLWFNGGLALYTSASVLKHDIFNIRASGEYNPGTRNEKYLIMPNRNEVRTLTRLDIRTALFEGKSISLNNYFTRNRGYYNREYLTNIRSDSRQYGALLSLNNRVLPLSVSFRNSAWKQQETETARVYSMDQNSIEGRISRSFTNNDNTELRLTFDDYSYNYNDINETANRSSRISFINNLWLDKNKRFTIATSINGIDQKGSYMFRRMEISERIALQLPANLRFTGSYNYFSLENNNSRGVNNRGRATLSHRLFESLNSSLFAERASVNHTLFEEQVSRGGVNFRYTKKIRGSRLNLSYSYFRQKSRTESKSSTISITDESLTLEDGETVLLARPFADQESIILRDNTGTIVYTRETDYLVQNQGDYTIITRVPGGLISNGQVVIAEYTALQPGTSNYIAGNNSASASLLFFNNHLEIYYRGAVQSYPLIEATDLLVINRFHQNIAGFKINSGAVSAGVETDRYNSTIIPYRRIRYFINSNFTLAPGIIMAINGNISDYKLTGEDLSYLYSSINSRIIWRWTPRTRASAEAGYLSQEGRNIDLKMVTGRITVTHSVRRLEVSGGLDFYSREYSGSKTSFTGTNIKITRKFH